MMLRKKMHCQVVPALNRMLRAVTMCINAGWHIHWITLPRNRAQYGKVSYSTLERVNGEETLSFSRSLNVKETKLSNNPLI